MNSSGQVANGNFGIIQQNDACVLLSLEKISCTIEAVVEQLSDYERERGKPMPTLNHAYVQKNLFVSLDYR